LGKEFDGHFAERAEKVGFVVDPSSLEASQQRGITDRNRKTFKSMVAKSLDTSTCSSWSERRELVDLTYKTNRLLIRVGFLQIQWVMGYNPRITGGLMRDRAQDNARTDKIRIGDEGVRR
jgi:hypothetical protein